jgi:O-antigen/teichoic acid export membrane protein
MLDRIDTEPATDVFTRFRRVQRLAESKVGVPGSVRRRFASAVLWNIVASVVSRSMVLLAAIGCARFLGKSGFGQLGIVQTTANMVSALAALGLGVTATRYVADLRERDPERAGRIIGLSWTITAVSGATLAVLSIFTARPIAVLMMHAPELAVPIRIASVIVFLNAMLAYQNGALSGFEAFRPLASINLISGILSLPIVLAGVWRWGLNGAVAGIAVSLVINWWLNERLLRKECKLANIPIRIREGFQEATVFWTFSLPALVGSLSIAPVLWFCSTLIVRSPRGFEQMALYAGADRWRLAILFIPTALFRTALPMLSNLHEQDPAAYRRVHRAHLLLNLMVVVAPVLLVACFSVPIMNSYGSGFRAGWPVLVVLCAATIPEALNTVFSYPLMARGKMWFRCAFDLALSLILLLLGMWLIPVYGALGFAVAYMTTFFIIALGLYLVTREGRYKSHDGSRAASGPSAVPSAH